MSEPTTEAGRALLADSVFDDGYDLAERILAIEAQAAEKALADAAERVRAAEWLGTDSLRDAVLAILEPIR